MSSRPVPLFARSVLCILLSGCASGCIRTAVEGGLSPRHFHFHDVVTKKDDNEPGGWRAACLEVGIERNNTGELFYCKFGVEMPITNARQGEIPIDRAQSIAASCANQAAKTTLSTVTPTTPIGIACEEFKTLYHLTLKNIIDGARVTKRCREGIPPVRLTPPRPYVMSLDRTQLISVALNYWQSFKDYSQEPSPEDQRRFAIIEQKLQEHDRWLAFQKELRGELPEFDIGDYTGPGPCFCCVAYPSRSRPQPDLRWVVVGCVSFLAPVYVVYGVQFDYSNNERIFKKLAFWPLPPEIQATANTIARRIEATFAVTALPRELAEFRVPLYVQFTEPPETTLFHALFLDSPENLP